jgi:two-component system OmpR family sensor kinase
VSTGHPHPHPRPRPRPGQRGGLAGIPLRITLVALLMALVTSALVATGFATSALLKGYLEGQQDDRLWAAVYGIDARRFLDDCSRGEYRELPGSDYYACIPPGGQAATPALGPPDRRRSLPDAREVADEARDGTGISTVRSADGRTTWRVVTADAPDGWTVVVGTDLERDEGSIRQLVSIQAIVGLVVLTVLGATGYVLVRNSLRPLAQVERTARAIAGGDLSQRVPEGDERTEVGRLTTALNGMLSRIEQAFRAQQESEAQARRSEERMRRFVADASHELRTPLTSIRGFAELYRQGAVHGDEEVRRLMQRIEREGGRMGTLVEDLLLLARMDQQRPLSLRPVDLAEVASDAVHDARAVQPDRPITLHLDDSLTDVPVLRGDEGRLRQVVGNLVTNALVHTPAGTRITVTLAEEGDPGGTLVLRVADQGPGMQADDAARVFERFYRADTSRTRAAGGTGLGLSIVDSLVAAHGGTVHLETAPGRGTTVTVRLPRSGPPRAADPADHEGGDPSDG